MSTTPSEITRFSPETISQIYREAATADPRQKSERTAITVGSPSLTRLQRFNLLSLGEWKTLHSSQSEADLELCCFLAEAHDGHVDNVERDFRVSKLYRSPAEGKHDQYPRMTAQKACAEFLVKPGHSRRLSEVIVDPSSWRELYATYQALMEAKDAEWVVDRWARNGDITLIGALPKDGKTWVMLAIARAMLTGEKLFGHFPVKKSERVVYLIPEAGIAAIKRRLVKMRLMEFVKEGRLYVMPRSISMVRKLNEPRIRESAKGADVFIDTAIRFIEGDENKAVDVKIFSENCLDLATLARTVWAAHHAPKSFAEAKTMSLENMLRGSGDLAAMLSNAFGIAKVNRETTELHIESLGQRDDDEYLAPFRIQGRPHIDETGEFKLVSEPGQAGTYSEIKGSKKGGRPPDPEKAELTLLLVELQENNPDAGKETLAELLKTHYNKKRSPSTVGRYLKEHNDAKSAANAVKVMTEKPPF